MSTGIQEAVREWYRDAAVRGTSCCGGDSTSSCCGGSTSKSVAFGYTFQELATLPDGADLALGCGNPTALAGIAPGETVVDLGSGGGIDCFLAAARVGDTGRVIGVDMTPEMLSRARKAAEKGGFTNVEFRLGEIEHLPVADATVDLVISNCVVNLSADKGAVMAEVARVLRPGGRISISDVVMAHEVSDEIRANARLFSGCIAGAMVEEAFLATIADAGLVDVRVESRTPYAKMEHLEALAAEAGISDEAVAQIVEAARSVTISARRP